MKIIIIIFIYVSGLSAQIQNFDSSFTIAGHPGYHCLNPEFEKLFYTDYFEWDYFTFVYEKRNKFHSHSDIVFRKVLFENIEDEVTVAGDGFMNTEPSASHSIIAWQSDRNGNQDIYYSTYNGIVWSVPVLLQQDSADDIFPDTEEIKFPGISPCYFILFQRNNDIILNQIFENDVILDTNLTSNVAEVCSEPKIKHYKMFGFDSRIYIAYLKNVNGINRINVLNAEINSSYNINWQTSAEINQLKSPSDINISNSSFGRIILHYNYDTLGSFKNVGFYLNNPQERIIISNEPGANTEGRGASMLQSLYHPVFNAFGWLKKINDSSKIVATDFRAEFGVRKEFYIGNSSVNSRLAMSSYFPSLSSNKYRYRLVWEQEIEGRTALKMSVYDEFLASINSSNETPEKFTLLQNFPNPFNPSTKIKFYLPVSNNITITINDMLGRKLIELTNGRYQFGDHEVIWNAADFPAGVYFYTLKTEDFVQTKRMLLLK